MLHKRHDLDMRVAHVADVVHELHRQVVIGVKLTSLRGEGIHGAGVIAVLVGFALRRVAVALPRSNMHLVDVKGLRHVIVAGAALEPRGVVPLVAIEGPQRARRPRRALGLKGVRIGLVELFALVGLDEIFIELTLLGARNKAFPNRARMHGTSGLACSSQSLNSPMTWTLFTSGAQTQKRQPRVRFCVSGCAPIFSQLRSHVPMPNR